MRQKSPRFQTLLDWCFNTFRSAYTWIATHRRTGLLIALLVSGAWLLLASPAGAQVVDGDGGGNIFLPMISTGLEDVPVVEAPTPVADESPTAVSTEVFGLVGALRTAIQQEFGNYFVSEANRYFAIVGQTPAIERELDAIAARGPDARVKVWGTLSPRGATVIDINSGEPSGPIDLIVASEILEETSTEVAGPAAPERAPSAVSKYNAVNLRAGPSMSYAVIGQITEADECEVQGRNSATSWWLLLCDNGIEGWIDMRFVNVTGATQDVPIFEVIEITPEPTPTPTAAPPTPTPQVFTGWRTSFFGNTELQGEPIAIIDAPRIDFNWGVGSPYPGVPADNFSARFERQMNLFTGYYRFTATADDGVRFWLNNQLLIDEWHGSTGQTYTAGIGINGGLTDLRVEYFEGSGNASIRFNVEFVSTVTVWQAEYFSNPNLAGSPVLSQSEPSSQDPLNYDWSFGSPASGVLPADGWSARWRGNFDFLSGNYRFRARANDGVRVYIDDLLVLDGWSDGEKDINNMFFGVGSGNHAIRVEYYDRAGPAFVRVWWYRDSTARLE